MCIRNMNWACQQTSMLVQVVVTRINKQAQYEYDNEGTDEDDLEFVSAREKLTQEKNDEVGYEDELVMLEKIAYSKEKK
uniref:Uncharacterized protein n=1 Tax=Chenopodium quinoa TaxID=63459 RepID=A0A803KUM6_CHEQI